MTYFTMGFGLLLLVVVLLLLAWGGRRAPGGIVLPQAQGDSAGVEDGGAESRLNVVVITPETVRPAINTLSRPASYSRVQRVETFWSGGSGQSVTQIHVSGGRTRLDTQLSDGSVRHMLVVGGAAGVWYDDEREWAILRSRQLSADLAARTLTYETVRDLPVERIVQADYRSLEGVYCIYVETAPDGQGYVERYWVSVDTCLLHAAERLQNGALVYRASLKKGGRPMPTQTFFNLPPPKREKLLRAAVTEFARRPYGEVSINRIIQAAGIPRGSFYQYFTDKTDLFRHVLRCYDKLLEEAVSKSLASCGQRPLELPLALFDRILAYIQANREEFALFLGILRQNVGMDAGQLLALPDMVLLALEQADWSGLTPESREERLALLGLLLSCAGQALMAVCCCGMAAAECRRQLELRTALIRRGAEIKEENPC